MKQIILDEKQVELLRYILAHFNPEPQNEAEAQKMDEAYKLIDNLREQCK